MNFKLLCMIPVLAMMCACGGATTNSSPASASLSLPVGALFDAEGTWYAGSTTCASFPVPAQFDNVVQSVVGNLQTFTADEASVGNVIIFPSEGSLDTQTGAYTLCYSSTLADCGVRCTGTVDASQHVTLNCAIAATSGTCTIDLQK